jgi:hypothetical protein
MNCSDPRGHRTGTGSTAARDAAERALWRMMSFYDTPLADLEAAEQADPGWAMPHAMKAGFLLSLTEPSLVGQAATSLQAARERERSCTPRERAHLEALTQVQQGRWAAACRTWDELLVEHPRDALALQWAHLWDFYRGDAPALRGRPARALPEWDEADPLYGYVLALHAFGLEESNLYPQAEEAGRRALQANPRVPWAVHAVAHVMEMQGRFEEGAAWLRQHQNAWAEGNGFATHLWWHKCLFRLEALDLAGVMRLVDKHFQGAQQQGRAGAEGRTERLDFHWPAVLQQGEHATALAGPQHRYGDKPPGLTLDQLKHHEDLSLCCAAWRRAYIGLRHQRVGSVIQSSLALAYLGRSSTAWSSGLNPSMKSGCDMLIMK